MVQSIELLPIFSNFWGVCSRSSSSAAPPSIYRALELATTARRMQLVHGGDLEYVNRALLCENIMSLVE